MPLKKSLSRYQGLIKTYLNTPEKLGVFLSMAVWAVIIRTLLHLFKTNRVIPLIMRAKRKASLPPGHITRYLYWLERLKFLHSQGDCLPKSLLCYRFLSLAGASPTLVIGFQNQTGHAWVELDGEVISEPPAISAGFIPALTLRPGMAALSPITDDSAQVRPS